MPDTPDFSVLEKQTDSIIEKLLVRSTLVQPGPAISGHPALSAKFEQAVSLYRVGAFSEAKDLFTTLADLADLDRPNAGFTPRLNAAVCATASKDWSVVLDLLAPIFNTGHLYGHPLWNLALAYYHLNQISDALEALEVWVRRAFKGHARGLLLIAALALKNGDRIRGKETLQRTIEVDPDFVDSQLQSPSLGSTERHTHAPALRPQPPLDTAVRVRLLALVQPKRPERRPELNFLLPGDAMEVFTSAIEEIAEGRFQQAKDRLTELRERLPHVQHLHFAVGACELFIGNNEKAKNILLPAIESGARVLGSALWNLACAQIRLGDFSGARDALLKCSETEYKTKGQLWVALGVLTLGAKAATEEGTSKVVAAIPGASSGPQPLAERRRMQMERLIKPRKIPPSYKPDLAKLTIRDRETVEQILREASQADPSNALSMLVPWIALYPAIFALKVHGAAFALFARDLSEALRLLLEASELRPLDAASRWNLAYVCLCKSDYLGIIRALEGGENYPMAEKSDYWLVLAVARATCGDGDPSAPGARSLALATSDVSRKIIASTLSECEIVPAASVQVESPAITVAREAQRRLEQDNLAGARECLNQICGDQFERIGEIGDRVFDPQFERLPDPKWSSQLSNCFVAAVKAYEEDRVVEAAEDFRRLQDTTPRPRIATNWVAALLKAGQRNKARSAARRSLTGLRRPSWQFFYNYALSQNQSDNAVRMLERRLRDTPRGLCLIAALCRVGIDNMSLRGKLAPALDRLRESTVQPSLELLLALAWAQLIGPNANKEKCLSYLKEVLDRTRLQALIPPAEINAMQQVRAAYQQLKEGGKGEDALQYLSRIVEAKEAERSEQPSRNIDKNVGVELVARECLVAEYSLQGRRLEALQMLDACETLLLAHADAISPGFLAKDWLEIERAHDN
jgi:tetratricopeptide (TPR) repeat protein